MSFDTEFGSDYAIEESVSRWFVALGFEDSSWHNDICPSYTLTVRGKRKLLVFVDAHDENERECGPGPRFSVHYYDRNEEQRDTKEFQNFEDLAFEMVRITNIHGRTK